MSPPQAPVLELDSVLPLGQGEELAERLARLSQTMRNAPMSAQTIAAFDGLVGPLTSLPSDFLNTDHVMCLVYLSRGYYYSANPAAGLQTARQAVALARRIGDEALRAKALVVLGGIYLEAGTYPDTVSTMVAALEAAIASGDRALEVQILTNLGVAHQYASHFGYALNCHERALAVAQAAGLRGTGRGAALANIALAHLLLNDHWKSIAAAKLAVDTLDEPQNPHERHVRAMVEGYYARALLAIGDLAGARERVALARQFAAEGGELAAMSAESAQGFVEVHDPATRDIGLSRLQRCVDRSRKGSQSALRDALTVIVRAFEIGGRPNAALVYLHEIAQLNRDQQLRRVIQYHHLHLADLREGFDDRAAAVLEEQRFNLSEKRTSMDALRESMLVLEKNTVAAELHDDDTGEHCYRMGALARELARRIGMDEQMANLIDLSARLHDIGKIAVPDSILMKPGRLNPDERVLMQNHCVRGWEIIAESRVPELFLAQEIALNHHERWDGTGYPNRRAGHMIPLAARITALADVFDALTHRRCYKEAWSVDQALREITALRATQFDPGLTDEFLKMIPDLQSQHPDLDRYLAAEARTNDFVTDRARLASILKSQAGTSS